MKKYVLELSLKVCFYKPHQRRMVLTFIRGLIEKEDLQKKEEDKGGGSKE